MHVISFVTQKGGSGKTTLAINCAVAAEKKGHRALILDLDPQATAEAWYQDREEDKPALAVLKASDLEMAITGAKSKGFRYIFIDTPGRDEPATATAIKHSDFCLIPCRPSPGDMKATPPTMATIKRLQKPGAFVLTQTPVRGFRIREAQAGLSVLGMVAPEPIVSRSVYQDAQGRGLGVAEYEPDGKAADEIARLWSWVVKKIGKIGYE